METRQPHESKPSAAQPPLMQRALVSLCILVSVLSVLVLAAGCSTARPWVNDPLPSDCAPTTLQVPDSLMSGAGASVAADSSADGRRL